MLSICLRNIARGFLDVVSKTMYGVVLARWSRSTKLTNVRPG